MISYLEFILSQVPESGPGAPTFPVISPASPVRIVRLQLVEMSDTLYLSLWYPNLLLAALPDKLTAVLGAFAAHGGEARVYAATVWPMSWSESPVFQCVYGHGERGADAKFAVEEALELLHDRRIARRCRPGIR